MRRPSEPSPRQALAIALLGCIGVAAALLLLVATPWGLGLGGDSYYYVSGARSLLAGQGFARPVADGSFRPITHFPPLYSLLLAGLGVIGGDIVPDARVLQVVLFGLNAALAGWLVWRATRARWLGAAGALFIGLSPAMLSVHSWLLSEALFLFLTLAGAACLAVYIEGDRRVALVGAGLAAGLAVLTRYAGIALVLAGIAALITRRHVARGRRWIDVFVFLVPAFGGWLVWTARNAVLAGSVANRTLLLHLPGAAKLVEGLATIAHWLVPGRVPTVVGGAAALIVGACLFIVGIRRLAREQDSAHSSTNALLTLAMAFLCAYSLLLLASLSLADASTPLDDRILSPVYVLGLVGILVACPLIILHGSWPRWLVTAAVAGMLLLTALRGAARVIELRRDGQGYAGRAWSASQVIAWVADLDPAIAVYSNEMDALYLLAGRQAYQVPIRWDPVRAAPREDFEEQLAAMRTDILLRGAVLVLFNTIDNQQTFFPSRGELTDGLAERVHFEDGAVYVAPETSALERRVPERACDGVCRIGP
jgi:4-amino-4-deoxy-L-arabinose transferase-like glycosyltransferase